jgi:dihydrofolate reductase
MRPLRYSINVTLDGCVDHQAVIPDAEMHRYHTENLARAGALLFGRVTYQMMEEGWQSVAETGEQPEWMDDWMVPFAHVIHSAKKYVVSSTLDHVHWNNAELIRGDLEQAVRALKQQPGNFLLTGGVTLPTALAELGLIDEYEFVVHPRIAGHGPTLLAGLSKPLDLRLVSRRELGTGAVVLGYTSSVEPQAPDA